MIFSNNNITVTIDYNMAKILIIDDDIGICAALGKFLRRQGHEVITAMDGKLGLAAALECPDLIICDLAMPALGGHGVLSALRQDKRMADIPFIFLSGSSSREQIRQSMNMGGDDFITKPAELSEILDTVNSRLRRRQEQQHRHEEELKKAVQIFAGIVNDLGSSEAAIHWLAEAATADQAGDKLNPAPQHEQTSETPDSRLDNPPAPTTFLATRNNRRYFVKLSEVKVLLADGEYSKAFWGKDQSMMFRKSLKQWETELPQSQFIRIHRKAMINLSFLDYVDKSPTGKPQVHLKEYAGVIEVSQRKIPTLNRTLKSFTHISSPPPSTAP